MEEPAQGMEEPTQGMEASIQGTEGPAQGMEGLTHGMERPSCHPTASSSRSAETLPVSPAVTCPRHAPPANPLNVPPASPQPVAKFCRHPAPGRATLEPAGASLGSSAHTRSLPALLMPPIPNDKRTNISLFKPNYLAAIYTQRGPREPRGQPPRRLAPRWKGLGYTTRLLIPRGGSFLPYSSSASLRPAADSQEGQRRRRRRQPPDSVFKVPKNHGLVRRRLRRGWYPRSGDVHIPKPGLSPALVTFQSQFLAIWCLGAVTLLHT
ncbi:uncharacterized protein LOC141931404 [Strix aluco]|uniref:uncharacterized protein LOC141931404 n=1 Tax=Strix aluco TaxID=111821 RepID=UPI003DA495B3